MKETVELIKVGKELAFQNEEKEKRVAELIKNLKFVDRRLFTYSWFTSSIFLLFFLMFSNGQLLSVVVRGLFLG